MKTNPLVAIVVLSWNQLQLTLACLESLQGLEYPDYRVLLVDNASTDGTPQAVRERYPQVAIIENRENLGYAEGNNVGIRRALEDGADYVLVLNNDTLVAPDLLSELVRVAAADSGVGLVGPTIYYADPPDMVFALGSRIRWAAGTIRHRGMFQPASQVPGLTAPEPVDFLPGTAVLMSRQCLERVGLFDPAYFLNFEDVELCVRAGRHGFRVLFAPQAVIWHRVSATLGLASPANTYYMTRNALRFFWGNAPPGVRCVSVACILLRTLRTVSAWSLKSQYKTDLFRRKRDANLLALRDFFLGRFGKMGPDVARVCYSAE